MSALYLFPATIRQLEGIDLRGGYPKVSAIRAFVSRKVHGSRGSGRRDGMPDQEAAADIVLERGEDPGLQFGIDMFLSPATGEETAHLHHGQVADRASRQETLSASSPCFPSRVTTRKPIRCFFASRISSV